MTDAKPNRQADQRLTHGFRTHGALLTVFCIWQAGDMRETSSFV